MKKNIIYLVLILIVNILIGCSSYSVNTKRDIEINDVMYSNKTKELLPLSSSAVKYLKPLGYEEDNYGRVSCNYSAEIKDPQGGYKVFYIWIILQKIENGRAYYIKDMSKNENVLLYFLDETTRKDLIENTSFWFACAEENIKDENANTQYRNFRLLNYWDNKNNESIEICSSYKY